MKSIERDDPWIDRLSEYLDDELSARERVDLEQHLAACAQCTAVLADLRDVMERATRMKVEAQPARDLWPAIEQRLVPRAGHRAVSARIVRLGLAAAAALVLACAAGLWLPGWQRSQDVERASTTDSAERQYEQAIAHLQREARERLTLDPHVVEVLDENLATLDAAIATYREALSQAPADRGLRTRLSDAKRRKLEVLQQAVALTTDGNE